MASLIDLHNHILPGVDDGAVSLEESVEIARQFVSEGVTRIAATPHLDPERHNGASAPVVHSKVVDVRLALASEGVELEVGPGNELYLTPDSPEIVRRGEVSKLGDGNYLLVEVSLASASRPLFLDEIAFQLELAGCSVILAHPERYAFVQRDVAALDELRDRGVAMQVTAPALLGEYGENVRRTAEKLLRRGTYTLGASDRHHPTPGRSLAAMHERIAELVDVETADLLLCENPARVLADRPLIEPESTDDRRGQFFARLLRR
jgi:protein-tyrosine phosphatase